MNLIFKKLGRSASVMTSRKELISTHRRRIAATTRPAISDAIKVIGITAGLLLLLECGLRIVGTIRSDVYGGGERSFDDAGHLTVDVPQIATRAGKRVLFVGDSNTFGVGVRTEESFVEVIERLLPGVQAINLGVSGYSSYQGRMVLERHLATLRPDVVVVSFNFNDRATREAPDSPEEFRRAFSPAGPRQTLARAAAVPYTTRALQAVLVRTGMLTMQAPIDVTMLRPRVDEDSYRDNIARMVRMAREAGAQAILLQLGDNPLASYHTERGAAALASGNIDLAIGHLRVALGSEPFHRDLARLYLARAFTVAGRDGEVPRATRSASAYTLIRPDHTYHAIMRAVGASENVDVVDGVTVLQPEHYIDVCHFNAAGHAAVAAALAPRLAKLLRI
jgi:lysophospholipase L1-like esterase